MTHEGQRIVASPPPRPDRPPVPPPPAAGEGFVNQFMLTIRAELDVIPAAQTETTEEAR